MIARLEARQFCCLRHTAQDLGRFHVLVGPNASGKSTFLDAVAFLGRLVAQGPEAAVGERTRNFHDLVWGRSGRSFDLAVELTVPPRLLEAHAGAFVKARYEVGLRLDPQTGEIGLGSEIVSLEPGGLRVVCKTGASSDAFSSEVPADGWTGTFVLGPSQSALANLPHDPQKFPVATWLKDVLKSGVHPLALHGERLRQASPPGKSRRQLLPDGSNLPWLVAELEEHHPERLGKWVAHLKTALPELETVRSVERPDDRHRYLMLGYGGGFEVPSWRASEGTLRLMALTLLAYLPEVVGVHLVEEPENGIHPQAIETLLQSLSSIYEAQVLLATHSPVVLGVVEPEDLLCFRAGSEGATEIVRGSEHPMLAEWHREPDLSTLFAAGILG